MNDRAVILPYPGDPFLLRYWLDLFFRVWANEVSKLYVVCNTPVETEVVEYIEKICNHPIINFTYIDHHIQHGDAINIALDKVTEKNIMLVEDDGFIFKPGIVDSCFKDLESGVYDIVGSKRGSCSNEILERAAQLWNLNYSGAGDQGCNFWPCYFYSAKALLLRTDRDFNSRAWAQGDIIAPLHDCKVEVPMVTSDTFVSASLQLLNLVPQHRIHYLPQYHAHPDDIKHSEQHAEFTPFDGRASWLHVGSLSSGVSGAIMDDQGRSISKRKREEPHGKTILPSGWCDVNSDMQKQEWERRVQFWLTFWETRNVSEIKEFAELYKFGLDQLIDQFQLRIKQIKQRQDIYRQFFGL